MTPFGAPVVHRPDGGSSIWSRSRTSMSLSPLSRSRTLDSLLAQARKRRRLIAEPTRTRTHSAKDDADDRRAFGKYLPLHHIRRHGGQRLPRAARGLWGDKG